MSLTFIVAEFNPLTNGHKHLICEAKRLLPNNKIVVIMSGNFVQRGEPAIVDKLTRSKVALAMGVDAVIELPAVYSISSAEDFAYGAIKLASSFEGTNTLIFGSECGDLDLLATAEMKLRNLNNSPIIKNNLKSGKSFATSQIQAVGGVCFHPNNLLGVMYLKAIKDTNSSLIPTTIKRVGNYNSTNIAIPFVSATAIRERVYAKDLCSLEGKVPEPMFDELQSSTTPDTAQLFTMIKYKFMTTKIDSMNQIEGVAEGIEYRIKDKLMSATNFNELTTLISTKRYPESKVRRILLNILFDIKKEIKQEIKKNLNFFRVLGVRDKNLYSTLSSSSMTMLTKKKDEKMLDEKQKSFLAIDTLADDIYEFIVKL